MPLCAPHNPDRLAPFVPPRDRQNESYGRRRPGNPHDPFSSKEYNVAGFRFVHRQSDGFGAVGFDQIFAGGFLHSNYDIADDFQRIFLARIVAGENRQVAQSPRGFAHDWTFGAIT